MNEIKFNYGKSAQNKIALLFLLVGLAGVAGTYYYFFMTENVIWIGKRVISVFLILFGFGIFLYMKMKPKRTDEAGLIVSSRGIEGKTSIVAKSAGMIPWQDIAEINIGRGEILIVLHDPEKYKAKMQGFLAKDTFKASKGNIRISVMELEAGRDEIWRAIEPHLK